jgi:acetate kinase
MAQTILGVSRFASTAMSISKPTSILAINSGSSSIKFALYEMGRGRENLLARGAAEGIGLARGRVWLDASSDRSAKPVNQRLETHGEAIRAVLAALNRDKHPRPAAVGHRLVNGGPKHTQPERVSRGLIRSLQKVIPLAPLHLPTELAIISAIAAELSGTPQVACFDTAFHRTMPAIARHLPLPRALWRGGLQRYGFHGLSYEYIVSALGREARDQRVIVAHLGNGASLAAIRHGRSVETTMGFTPTGGVIMGTRTGDLDPGVLVYLMRERRWGPARFESLVDHESGLLGISGTTSDMKALLAKRSRDFRAREAVAMFCYSVCKQIGALAAVLGGCDTLVFTGGIGERAAPVRAAICRGLAHLGVRVARSRNAAHTPVISPPQSACTVRVIPTNEELVIARHTFHLTSR